MQTEIEQLLLCYHTHRSAHTNSTFYTHLKGVGQLREQWPCSSMLCLAGYCHAFYGTEGTANSALFTLSQRNQLSQYIDQEAERLVYLYSISKRQVYPKALSSLKPPYIINHINEEKLAVTRSELVELLLLDISNLAETTQRSSLSFRLTSTLYTRIRYQKAMKHLPDTARYFLTETLYTSQWHVHTQ